MSNKTAKGPRTRILLVQAFLALITWIVVPAQAAGVSCADASRHGGRLGIIGAACDRIYVSNEDTNSVSVISRQTLAVVKTIAVGPKPHHLHVSADGRFVYVAEYGWHKVAAISTADDKPIAESPLVASRNDKATTHAPWATADGHFIHTANQFPKVGSFDVTGEVGAIDATTGELQEERVFGTQGKLPSEVLVRRNGRIAYITLRGSGTVEAWETSPPRFLDTIDLNYEAGKSAEPDTIQLTPNGRQLIVTVRQRIAPNASMVKGVALIGLGKNNAVTHVEMATTTTGHHWLTRDGRYSFAAIEGNPAAAAAVVDNRRGATVAYLPLPDSLPTRPHGVYFERDPL